MNPSHAVVKAAHIMRIIYGGVLFHMILVVFLGEFYLRFQSVSFDASILIGITVLCFALLVFAIFMKQRVIWSAIKALRLNPDDKRSMLKWKMGNITSFVLFDSVVVFGLVIRTLGENRVLGLPFYIAGVGFMLLWWPKEI